MTDKEYNRTKQRIKQVARKWIAPLGLNWWHVDITYDRAGWSLSAADVAENWGSLARVHAKWQYTDANIVWNMPLAADLNDEDLDFHMRHELSHVLVNEMREWSGDPDGALLHEERVVTMLAKAFEWIRLAGYREGLKAKQGV